jgi:hypothetical protein
VLLGQQLGEVQALALLELREPVGELVDLLVLVAHRPVGPEEPVEASPPGR